MIFEDAVPDKIGNKVNNVNRTELIGPYKQNATPTETGALLELAAMANSILLESE